MRLFAKVDGVSDNFDRPMFLGDLFTLRFHNEFPTLSIGASFQNFGQNSAVDPTLRSEFEGGVVISRPRFTTQRKSFSVGYNLITKADKALLENLQTSIKIGAATFFWTNPDDNVEYEVRLLRPMQFVVEARNFSFWNVRLEMAQQ